MSTATLISEEEYLSTAYHPDCDFVNGEVLERNLGTRDHGIFQEEVLAWFRKNRGRLRVRAIPELRVRVAPRRYRIPDVSVINLPLPEQQVFTDPPYICIEVLSPDDSFPKLQNRLDDYLAMGVPNIWVLDPPTRRGWHVTREGHSEALDKVMRTSDGRVVMPIEDLFADEE